jgi:hypothetical protein
LAQTVKNLQLALRVFGLVEKKVRHKTPTYQALVVCFGTTMLAIASRIDAPSGAHRFS